LGVRQAGNSPRPREQIRDGALTALFDAWCEIPSEVSRALPSRPGAFLLDRQVKEHPDVPESKDGQARALGDLGLIDSRTGLKDRARLHYEKALTLYEPLCTAHPEYHEFQRGKAIGFINLGDLFRETGRMALAADRYSKALAVLGPLVKNNPRIREDQGFRINA
jgi:hypothetical protein